MTIEDIKSGQRFFKDNGFNPTEEGFLIEDEDAKKWLFVWVSFDFLSIWKRLKTAQEMMQYLTENGWDASSGTIQEEIFPY